MRLTRLIAAAAGLAMATTSAMADWQPSKPIQMWIAFGVGGSLDTVARTLAIEIEKQTGWKIVAENKPAGGGLALFSQLMHAPKDGTVIGVGVNMPILINLVQRPDEVPFKIDSFDYLASITRPEKAIIARADAPFSTIEEMIAHAKKNGLVVSAAAGPEIFVADALIKASDGKIQKLAAKGGAEGLTHLLGSHADVSFGDGTHLSYLERSEIKVIASINTERLSYAPDKPTLVEEGINISIDPIFYVAGPGGLDPEAKAALVDALDKAVRSDAVRKVVANTLTSEVENFGPEGTMQRLKDGLASTQQIFK